MVGAAPLEVAKTALEVADFTWTAVEGCRHHNLHHRHHTTAAPAAPAAEKTKDDKELESLRAENCRLRILLEEQKPKLLESCPPDIQKELKDSGECGHQLPVSSVEDDDEIGTEDYVIVSEGDVVDGIANFMARCVVMDPKGRYLAPGKLQKAITKAMAGESKVEKVMHIYAAGKTFHKWSKWGIALAGLYRARSILKIAAKIAITAL
ncbi:OLC1v1023969C1 [Oldenlandia corymbosa var. corymbosa]|uniref:OLC1v1023969C1 n=1 Tax=Oldenlandia corymbosa var. corymbosa TaxID=529605 RepID=A0AAV1C4Q6_OLDCO|nr:OLC1v1023969C1 [Oldenlandia corymbosa var. corymbosa]